MESISAHKNIQRKIMNEQMVEDLEELTRFGFENQKNVELILKKVNQLDNKYSSHLYYYLNVEGELSNLALDINSIKLINFVIKRLKEKIKKVTDKENKNKFKYELGTSYQSKAILENPYPTNFEKLVEQTEYSTARDYFNQVEGNFFSSAQTNQASILDKYGRNFEAILLYEKVLRNEPTFGMALGKKANAIYFYYHLSPYKDYRLLTLIKNLLSEALLQEEQILKIGGENALTHFKNKLNHITNFLADGNVTTIDNKDYIITDYENFVLKNNLFLNFDFGFIIDEQSLVDNLNPPLTQDAKVNSNGEPIFSDKTRTTFKIFNQIHEDFASLRYLFYEYSNKTTSELDEKVRFIYTHDYSKNSIHYGILKIILSALNNILDKIARAAFTYFEVERNDNIYFKDIENKFFKQIVLNKKNYQLLALYHLAKDFNKDKVYFKFKDLRNKITHETVDIFENDVYETPSYSIDHLKIDILDLFLIVKSAILYLFLAIETDTKKNDESENRISLNVTFQREIFPKSPT